MILTAVDADQAHGDGHWWSAGPYAGELVWVQNGLLSGQPAMRLDVTAVGAGVPRTLRKGEFMSNVSNVCE